MNTDALIANLARDMAPIAPGAPARRLWSGVAIGAVFAAIVLLAMLGPRPDLTTAAATPTFWLKLAYTGSIALIGLSAARWLSRPEAAGLSRLRLLAAPGLMLAAAAGLELASAPREEWRALLMGSSASYCPWIVLVTALPVYAGIVWAFRRFAPTRLAQAGLATGLGAGGVAATVYCLHCPESSALFVLSWYTLGIMLATLVGGVTGRWLLRW